MWCVHPLPRDPRTPLQGQGPRGHSLSQTTSTFAHGGPRFSHQRCLSGNCTHTEFEGQEILELEEKSSNTLSQAVRCTEIPEIVLNANSSSQIRCEILRFYQAPRCHGCCRPLDHTWSYKDLIDLHWPLGFPPATLGLWPILKSAPEFKGLVGKKKEWKISQ